LPQPGVIFGGPSPEHDVSILTGLQAARALGAVKAVYWAKTGDLFEVDPGLEGADFLEGPPRKAPQLRLVAGEGLVGKKRPLDIDALVNCCHGGPGEDGTLQGALDLAAVPYTGPAVAGAALGMDKLAFGDVVTSAGLPSLPRVALTETTTSFPWDGPTIVKPRFGGSSIGIEIVEDAATAVALLRSSPHLRTGAVAEPYRSGVADVEVAARSWPELQLSAVAKADKGGSAIYGYADKYVAGEGMVAAKREFLDAGDPLAVRARELATTVARLALVRGVARIDFLADGDELYVNEINTIPGSLAKYLWTGDAEVPFARLLGDMLAEARQRPSHHYTAAGADGTALRSAGTIAGKLG
jgi:D-alanine-D-alanine ligase